MNLQYILNNIEFLLNKYMNAGTLLYSSWLDISTSYNWSAMHGFSIKIHPIYIRELKIVRFKCPIVALKEPIKDLKIPKHLTF